MSRRTRPLGDRFWAKVDRRGPDECWPWTAAVGTHGYGVVGVGSGTMTAHRVAFLLSSGALPEAPGAHGGVVMHACDNRRCCNPAHLRGGSQGENLADAASKGRSRLPPPKVGEAVHTAKLKAWQVREIKAALAAGERGVALAARYCVAPGVIGAIRRGRTWRSVA